MVYGGSLGTRSLAVAARLGIVVRAFRNAVAQHRPLACLCPPKPAEGEIPDNDLIQYMQGRVNYMRDDLLADFLELDGVEEVLQESDKRELTALRKTGKVECAEVKQYLQELNDYRASLYGAGVSGGSSSSSLAKRPRPPWKAKQYPKQLPEIAASMCNDDLNKLLPPGFRACKESFHGRWRLFWVGEKRSKSAGWDMHGWKGSIHLLLRAAWDDYKLREGHECPMTGLY